ncbi:unnamed protein product [Euphydryas editha]|uniref:HTH psq-type domain-containing protein n=1 Tax=Euphydryas editha TaxID=104508 RepID=A0AAU9UNK4_EUPED|nr:unnamed protein product [Euphydryas editha]
MPRKRDRITEKCQWSLDALDQCFPTWGNVGHGLKMLGNTALDHAIKRVNDGGISVHKASQEFNIPYSTLQKRYRKPEQSNPRLGRKSVFSPAQE